MTGQVYYLADRRPRADVYHGGKPLGSIMRHRDLQGGGGENNIRKGEEDGIACTYPIPER